MPELQQNMIDDLTSVTTESWRTFRIMAEMVEALDTLNALKVKCISLFGTARCKPDSQEYKDAEKQAIIKLLEPFNCIDKRVKGTTKKTTLKNPMPFKTPSNIIIQNMQQITYIKNFRKSVNRYNFLLCKKIATFILWKKKIEFIYF